MKKLTISIVFITSIFLLSSCASIVSTSKWPLTINSDPTGAKVLITNSDGFEIFVGKTPTNLKLDSGAGYFKMEKYIVTIKMDGYDDKIVPISCALNGWYWGNILLGGLIGMLVVDPSTGAMFKLETNFISSTLTKTTASIIPTLKLLSINDLPEDLRLSINQEISH